MKRLTRGIKKLAIVQLKQQPLVVKQVNGSSLNSNISSTKPAHLPTPLDSKIVRDKQSLILDPPAKKVATVEETKNGKLRWFNDPHLLGNYVERKVKPNREDVDQVIQLVYRHLGAATPEVYGRLIKSLFNMKETKKAWAAYRKMLSVKKKPTTQTYTLLLNDLVHQLKEHQKNLDTQLRIFEQAHILWMDIAQTEDIPIYNINTILRLCHHTVEVGGWDLAWQMYSDMKNQTPNYPKPDVITFTNMLLVCAENRSEDGFAATMDVWETFVEACKENEKMVVDEMVLNPVLLACIRARQIAKAELALPIVQQWYNLPIHENESTLNRKKSRLVAGPQSIDLLLRLAKKLKRFELGKVWYNILVQERKSRVDNMVRQSFIDLLVVHNDFEGALAVAQELPDLKNHEKQKHGTKDQAISQICAMALCQTSLKLKQHVATRFTNLILQVFQNSKWSQKEFEDKDRSDLVLLRNCLLVLIKSPEHSELLETCMIEHVSSIVSFCHLKIQAALKKKNRLLEHNADAPLLDNREDIEMKPYLSAMAEKDWKLMIPSPKNQLPLPVTFEILILARRILAKSSHPDRYTLISSIVNVLEKLSRHLSKKGKGYNIVR